MDDFKTVKALRRLREEGEGIRQIASFSPTTLQAAVLG
jgi:hypothetical protein